MDQDNIEFLEHFKKHYGHITTNDVSYIPIANIKSVRKEFESNPDDEDKPVTCCITLKLEIPYWTFICANEEEQEKLYKILNNEIKRKHLKVIDGRRK
jgi:hypothetical protein